MHLFELPIDLIEHIFSYLKFDELARNRLVCKNFDEICKCMLNRGFRMIERRHANCLKAIKSKLPKRESERRYHNLARHCDVLASVETRLSMLSMTYSKYMDNNMCCFIPGKVIDEIRQVLNIVEMCHTLPRAHEVLQELRDISSMAIEHFDDKVAPKLKSKMLENKASTSTNSEGQMMRPIPGQITKPPVGIETIKSHYVKGQRALFILSKKFKMLEKKVKSQKQQLRVQKHMILYMSKRQAVQNANIAELKKRIEECDVKYRELTHSQSGIKGASSTPPPQSCPSPTDVQPPVLRHYSSQIRLDPTPVRRKRSGRDSPNIKPRKTTIDHPVLSILSQPLGGGVSREKRPRLSSMSTDDSMDSSNSSQDIRDITDDKPSCSLSESERNLLDNTEEELQMLLNAPKSQSLGLLRNIELNSIVTPNNEDCILISDDSQQPSV